MSVLVQMRVKVPDVDRFVATSKRFAPLFEEAGGRDRGVFQSESDPSEMTTLSEWDSHDLMHATTEKYGDRFNAEAGTEGLSWETRVWHEL